MGHDEHLNDPKKSGGPLVCTVICSGICAYFFGVYWLNNPDQVPRQDRLLEGSYYLSTVDQLKNDQFNCYSDSNWTTSDASGAAANWGIVQVRDGKEYKYLWAWQQVLPTDWIPITAADLANPDFLEGTSNVTQDFVRWFAAGFILQMIAIGAALVSCVALAIKSPCLLKFSSGFIGCIQCLGGLAWFIVGQVWRWNTNGMICAGVKEYPQTYEYLSLPYTPLPKTIAFNDEVGALIQSGNFMQTWIIIIYSLCGCCCLLAICGAVFAKKK